MPPGATLSIHELEAHMAKLIDPATDLKTRLQIVNELKESIEQHKEMEYTKVYATVLPHLIDALKKSPSVWKKGTREQPNHEHMFRVHLLELIQRFASTEFVRPHAETLIPLVLEIIRTDNEDMGILALKTFMDMYRNAASRPSMESHIAEFFNLLVDIYSQMPQVVGSLFSASGAAMKEPDQMSFTKAKASLKLVAELPAAACFIYQGVGAPVLEMFMKGPGRGSEVLDTSVAFLSLETEPEKNAQTGDEAPIIGSPQSIVNKATFADLLSAQIKSSNLVACFVKLQVPPEVWSRHKEAIGDGSVRMLRVLPAEISEKRRELLIALRHVFYTDAKLGFLPHIASLLDERVLLGPGPLRTGPSSLAILGYSTLADLIHHVRNELSTELLLRIVRRYSELIVDTTVTHTLHTLACKLIIGLMEIFNQFKDKEAEKPIACSVLSTLLETLTQRMVASQQITVNILAIRQDQMSESLSNLVAIEKTRAIPTLAYLAGETIAASIHEERLIISALLVGVKSVMAMIRTLDGRVPDAEAMSKVIQSMCKVFPLFCGEGEPRLVANIKDVFLEMEPHVFQEVWTTQMDLFMETAVHYKALLVIQQALFSNDATSNSLTAIVLRYLVDRLDIIGEDTPIAALHLRVFRLVFNAVGMNPEHNERMLLPHLGKMLIDIFPLAARTTNSMAYFSLIHNLFRAIGAKTSRFELVYKEVIPFIPELLDNINRFLELVEDRALQEILVEIALTMPVRLQHLIPHITALLKPLVFALGGGPEMVRQGLRTLELCIDNITTEVLNPLTSPVVKDLVLALNKVLQPGKENAEAAHTATRVLAKLGGKNRRVFDLAPTLNYERECTRSTVVADFGGQMASIEVESACAVAIRALADSSAKDYHQVAFELLRNQAIYLLQKDGLDCGPDGILFFKIIDGLIDTLFIKEVESQASDLLREISAGLFERELDRFMASNPGRKAQLSPFMSDYMDALPAAFLGRPHGDAKSGRKLVALVLQDLRDRAKGDSQRRTKATAQLIIYQASRIQSWCWDETWRRKMAGCRAIGLLISNDLDLGSFWPHSREMDMIRGLMSILKDMPSDPPLDVDEVVATILGLIRFCNPKSISSSDPKTEDTKMEDAAGDTEMIPPGSETTEEQMHDWAGKKPLEKAKYYLILMSGDLSSVNKYVREAVQRAFQLLAELLGLSTSELLKTQTQSIVSHIFSKPLRALPVPRQIGNISAITYLLGLNPPVLEPTEELIRLLGETQALADNEDIGHFIGRPHYRRHYKQAIDLRVACITLLTASLQVTDYFAQQVTLRQRVTQLYFKALYSPVKEVKLAADRGLSVILRNQSRLPKELLQNGLRPVLMNLSDHKKLTVSGLDGLARLLKLLTNYFKVEIGSKLLDHFDSIAQPNILSEAAYTPIVDNEDICKLVELLNIFHLLPLAANQFIERFTRVVVETETQLHTASPSVFTPALSKYLNRYPVETVELLFSRLKEPRWVRTIGNVIQSGDAPAFTAELLKHSNRFAQAILEETTEVARLGPILICKDLALLNPEWVSSQPQLLDALKEYWTREFGDPTARDVYSQAKLAQHRTVCTIWTQVLSQTPRADILFTLILLFTRKVLVDTADLLEFLYQKLIPTASPQLYREVLTTFFRALDDPDLPQGQVVQFARIVVIPVLHNVFARQDIASDVVDADVLREFHSRIWERDNQYNPSDRMKLEFLHMTDAIVQHQPPGWDRVKGDVIRFVWKLVISDDALARPLASLVAARFLASFGDDAGRFSRPLWIGLLRPIHENEGSPMIKQALDVLAPIMTARLPRWDHLTRQILVEDQAHWNRMLNTYRLILRHPDLFYPSRELFTPVIVQSLMRITSLIMSQDPRSAAELRTMILDLNDLVVKWDTRAWSEQEQMMSTDPPPTNPPWIMPLGLREAIISHLVRYGHPAPDPQKDKEKDKEAQSRPLQQISAFLGMESWKDVNLKLQFFSRGFDTPDTDQGNNVTLWWAKVLAISAAPKPAEWYASNAAIIFPYVKRAMSSDAIAEAFRPVFEKLLTVLPPSEDTEGSPDFATQFHGWITDFVVEALGSGVRVHAALIVLQSLVKQYPARIEPVLPNFIRLFARLSKEHLGAVQPTAGAEVIRAHLIAALDIAKESVAFYQGEHRKQLLVAMVQLIRDRASPEIRLLMLQIIRHWLMVIRSPWPTTKEQASLLKVMGGWSVFKDLTYLEFLELIYEIYTEKSFARSELTLRLEQSFILGCRADDLAIRSRFVDLFETSIPRAIGPRLLYIFAGQTWESVQDYNWMHIALDLILGAVSHETRLSPLSISPNCPNRVIFSHEIITPMRRILYRDTTAMQKTMASVFPEVWAMLPRREQAEMAVGIVQTLSKDQYQKQTTRRPSVLETLLTAMHACSPPIMLPPHLLKYLAKNFHAWYVSLELLQGAIGQVRDDDNTIRDLTQDALAELYGELAEEDYFYGLWRRRSLYEETNAALSFEQNGMYQLAQPLYEAAQNKARLSLYPFTASEYAVWEDHWIRCTKNLLQWDLLTELAAGEQNVDMSLECAWRTLQDWMPDNALVSNALTTLDPEVTNPRRFIFKAFYTLNSWGAQAKEQLTAIAAQQNQSPQQRISLEGNGEFHRLTDEGIQHCLRKWAVLPDNMTMAHIPLLHNFQLFLELKEASVMMLTLITTTHALLDKKAMEMKAILQAWRDRLPNPHDDIGLWNDLVSWRQHVFHTINRYYLPLLDGNGAAQAPNVNTHAHRGHHESAWIINRFAHTARKHGLLDVCHKSLNDIYKLPNIEISEAFLKLREQARCHFERPKELNSGLDVINNTNLMYFSNAQKGEFYALKGLFLHKLKMEDEANTAFGAAVQLDLNQWKPWALWGRYNDDMHQANPLNVAAGAHALSCYLQAASLARSAKVRPMLHRVLWLLSIDDSNRTIGLAWEAYKGEQVWWYWITLVPQLITSLSGREAKYAAQLLQFLSKAFPQSVFWAVRTAKEEFSAVKRRHMVGMNRMPLQQQQQLQLQLQLQQQAAQPQQAPLTTESPALAASVPGPLASQTGSQDVVMTDSPTKSEQPGSTNAATPAPSSNPTQQPLVQSTLDPVVHPNMERKPWDYIDEIVALLKTGHPLLALTLETIVDQMRDRLKADGDEELYRAICALQADALQRYSKSWPNVPPENTPVVRDLSTIASRYVDLLSASQRVEFEKTFVRFEGMSTLKEYIVKVTEWKERLENLLDKRPRYKSLETWSHWLVEYQLNKLEEVVMPGSWAEHKDNKDQMVNIQRFSSKIERGRMSGAAFKRFTIVGVDGSRHQFAIQSVNSVITRREEKMQQLFRVFNEILLTKKEARKRSLHFHILPSVHIAHMLRIARNDASYVTLIDVHDEHCHSKHIPREAPFAKILEKLRAHEETKPNRTHAEYLSMRVEIKAEIEATMFPPTILSNYIRGTMPDPASLWRFRRQFTLQMAANSFLSYCLHLSIRQPWKFNFSRESGCVALSDLVPHQIDIKAEGGPVLIGTELPFRLTPNLQDFITPIGIEGLLTASMLALGRGLTEPEGEAEKQLPLFMRDEVTVWYTHQGKTVHSDNLRLLFRAQVAACIDAIRARMENMSGKTEREKAFDMANEGQTPPITPVVASVSALINTATNPYQLMRAHDSFMPWF